MNAETDRFRRLHRTSGVLVAAAFVITAALAFFSRTALGPAYRCAVFACLAPSLGSLFFALIHRTTGGAWGDALAPFLSAGSRLAPWIWLFVLPTEIFAREPAPAWPAYDSFPMLALRWAIGAGVLFAVTQQLEGEPPEAKRWVGPVGLIAVAFTFHLLAEDWLVALEPKWHSTAFPLVWMVGQAVAGLACAVAVALACGVDSPSRQSEAGPLRLDWGNLLLAAMLAWCYVAFAQFLIIWAGNLPREISWFERRIRGGWMLVPPLLALLHFLAPLAVLLSRSAKRSPRALGVVAATLVGAQLLYTAWMILPAFSIPDAAGRALTVALGTFAIALFFNRYLAVVRHALPAA